MSAAYRSFALPLLKPVSRSFARKVPDGSRIRIVAGTLTRRGAVRVLAGAVLLGVAAALAGPVAAGAAGLPPGVAAPLMRGAT